jgi:hypothetical protein
MPDSPVVLGSTVLRLAFVGLTVWLAALFVYGVYWSARRTGLEPDIATRRSVVAAVLTAVWIGVTGVAASLGLLHFWAPPTMVFVLLPTMLLAIGLALSPLGRRIALGVPLAVLVGYQGFRVVVELMLHRAYREGLMPVQMSFAGRNFDVVTGISAILLGAWLATGGRSRAVVALWNTLGLALLLNVLIVAMMSAPTPFRVFMNEPSNLWITRAPWVWLPAVMVLMALFGHVLVYRRLLEPEPEGREVLFG